MRQQNYATYMHTKNKKLEQLGTTTSSSQASAGTAVDNETQHHGPLEPGIFLITRDILALYTSNPHDNGMAATASVLNTNNSQFPDAILQLIHFILDQKIFTFDT
eukprot:g32220.t1